MLNFFRRDLNFFFKFTSHPNLHKSLYRFSILDISKIVIYDLFYNFMMRRHLFVILTHMSLLATVVLRVLYPSPPLVYVAPPANLFSANQKAESFVSAIQRAENSVSTNQRPESSVLTNQRADSSVSNNHKHFRTSVFLYNTII